MARVRNRSVSSSDYVGDVYGDVESWGDSVRFVGLASKFRRESEELSAGDVRVGLALRLAGEPTIDLHFSRSLPFLLIPNQAIAGGIFDKYVKREIIGRGLASICFISISTSFWPCSVASCKNLCAQYASESGNGKTAFNDVDQCLRALEELDSLLLHASRKDPDASVNSMKAQINVALESLDSLLKTVPPDVLDIGKAIADSYRNSDEQVNDNVVGPELQQLESIL